MPTYNALEVISSDDDEVYALSSPSDIVFIQAKGNEIQAHLPLSHVVRVASMARLRERMSRAAEGYESIDDPICCPIQALTAALTHRHSKQLDAQQVREMIQPYFNGKELKVIEKSAIREAAERLEMEETALASTRSTGPR